jgi:hypothetical protein
MDLMNSEADWALSQVSCDLREGNGITTADVASLRVTSALELLRLAHCPLRTDIDCAAIHWAGMCYKGDVPRPLPARSSVRPTSLDRQADPDQLFGFWHIAELFGLQPGREIFLLVAFFSSAPLY